MINTLEFYVREKVYKLDKMKVSNHSVCRDSGVVDSKILLIVKMRV